MSKIMMYMVSTLILLAVAAWLFLGRAPADVSSDTIGASVDNGDFQKVVLSMKNGNYYPNTITVQSGKPVRIYLDNSVGGCYRSFTIRSFGVSKYLQSPKDYVEFTPTTAGSYGFACSMGMGRGTLIVT